MGKKVKVKTRMAPSPTGEYHIGHIRTLLYNWAYAKKEKGKFIIRIEDTDRERYVEGAVDKILGVITDYGFDWDEGPKVGGPNGPYIQSERLEVYRKYVDELVKKGDAYPCFCTQETLSKMRDEQKARGIPSTKYDKRCLKLEKSEVEKKLKENTPHVVRLKVPSNKDISFKDIIYGEITVNSKDIDDQVLIKSDGFPTYHFAVVVDDHLMKITHVMRGNDWLPSTPKHILLYDAFGWEAPTYIHLPNLKELGKSKKLSKRKGPVTAREFLDQGYLPEAVNNFLMLLGWNPKTEQEIFTIDEFIEKFEIKDIHKTDLVAFDRDKLDWMNGQYIKNLSDEDFVKKIKDYTTKDLPDDLLIQIAPLVKSRIKTLKEFKDIAGFFFEKPDVDKSLLKGEGRDHINSTKEALEDVDNWDEKNINNTLLEVVEKKNYKTGKFFMSLRIALTGKRITPPINESVVILGKEETLSRLESI